MPDTLYVADILFWFIVKKLVDRAPVWQSSALHPLLAALWVFIFIWIGIAVGLQIPVFIAKFCSPDSFGVGKPYLDGLGRLAQVIGVVCGGYAGLRGIMVWSRVFMAGGMLYLLFKVARYVLYG